MLSERKKKLMRIETERFRQEVDNDPFYHYNLNRRLTSVPCSYVTRLFNIENTLSPCHFLGEHLVYKLFDELLDIPGKENNYHANDYRKNYPRL